MYTASRFVVILARLRNVADSRSQPVKGQFMASPARAPEGPPSWHWPKNRLQTRKARCMHPNCMTRIEWRPDQQGRNPAFCSTAHRVAYHQDRKRLLAFLVQAEERRDRAETSRIRWLLLRYPDLTSDTAAPPVPPSGGA